MQHECRKGSYTEELDDKLHEVIDAGKFDQYDRTHSVTCRIEKLLNSRTLGTIVPTTRYLMTLALRVESNRHNAS